MSAPVPGLEGREHEQPTTEPAAAGLEGHATTTTNRARAPTSRADDEQPRPWTPAPVRVLTFPIFFGSSVGCARVVVVAGRDRDREVLAYVAVVGREPVERFGPGHPDRWQWEYRGRPVEREGLLERLSLSAVPEPPVEGQESLF